MKARRAKYGWEKAVSGKQAVFFLSECIFNLVVWYLCETADHPPLSPPPCSLVSSRVFNSHIFREIFVWACAVKCKWMWTYANVFTQSQPLDLFETEHINAKENNQQLFDFSMQGNYPEACSYTYIPICKQWKIQIDASKLISHKKKKWHVQLPFLSLSSTTCPTTFGPFCNKFYSSWWHSRPSESAWEP